MKKLVLVLVSALLLAVFIGFNYLLWEREGREDKLRELETNNASNSSTMNSLTKEIKSLEDENANLTTSIDQLKNLNLTLQSEGQQLKQERSDANSQIVDKNNLIAALLQNVNAAVFEDVIKRWADSIETQKYDAAYKLEFGWKSDEDIKTTFEDYSAGYKKNIKSIKYKSLKVDTDVRTTPKGQLGLIVVFDVKLNENVDTTQTIFTDGENKKLFKLVYYSDKLGFVIDSINNIQ
jgi:hypothetical protein